jgi:hypothetical protein
MTHGEMLAYRRGYNTGSSRGWPAHRPAFPPEPVVAKLMAALRELRDAADGQCARLDPADEFAVMLGPKIDAADEAMAAVAEWLLGKE